MAPETALRAEATTPSAGASAGKYLCFQLREEIYGLPILDVREIIGYMPIVPVPRAPSTVRGVINLRGRVIPVLDLRLRFGIAPGTVTEQTVIIVLQCDFGGETRTLGLLVDQVHEVVQVGDDQVEPPPAMATEGITFLRGIAKTQNRVVFLLESPRLLEGAHAAAA